MEVGVHDMESVEEFTRRVVKAMNMKNRTDIFIKFLTDLMWYLIVGPILRLFKE
jgi:fructose-1,6-bisphosphatase